MASNLNQAFMRAYAKDRQHAGPAQAPDWTPPTSQPAPVNPEPVPAPVAPTATPTATPLSTASPTAALERLTRPTSAKPLPTQSPLPAQPTPTPTPTPVAQPRVLTPQANSVQVHSVQAKVQHSSAQGSAVRASTQPANTVQVSASPAHSAQRASVKHTITQVAPTRVAPVAAKPATPAAPVVSSQVDSGKEATDVWRRIDQAHSQQVRHPGNANPRESVSVGTTTTKHLHTAAAALAPVAPARPQPIAPVAIPTAAPNQPADDALPLTSAPLPGATDAKSAETRRRTVADFLYAAGQYNPGRILAADTRDAPSEPMLSPQASRPADNLRSEHTRSDNLRSDLVEHPVHQAQHVATTAEHRSAVKTATDTVVSPQPIVHPLPSMPTGQPDVVQEPLPRRMGQILRVDVPRGAAAASAEALPRTQSAQPTDHEPVSPGTVAPSNQSSIALEAPVAKYVQEQRRLDLAHKLNEAEEKLRRSAHQVFNPVWEVDSLQWPAVVDKLMEQRAEAMAHVAAHLKSACQAGLSVLGVTSASPSEGRTTVACCLARLAASHGLHVALIDLDLDRPTLCLQTNMEVEQDWRDALTEEISLAEVAVHSIDDQLTVFPLKPRGTRPGLLASDGRLAEMLAKISESFELVIVDCARTSSSGNVITGLARTQVFDAAIVVVDRRQTEQSRVEDAVRLVQQTGIESIGIVDNFSV